MVRVFAGLALVLLLGSASASTGRAGTVSAQDYRAFWLWGGGRQAAALSRGESFYLLQGAVLARWQRHGQVVLVAQGPPAIPRLPQGEGWLVYRSDTLDWPASVISQIIARVERWRAAGNRVAGIQVDFDAATPGLGRYVDFLGDLRRRLPADLKLSTTGLMDWGRNSAPEQLERLAGIVDEVVIQTYQGRTTIANYQAYMDRIARLRLPFKIGLVEGGEWTPPPTLSDNPQFKGYVVFLLSTEGGGAGTTIK